ncbi:hypothetical protein GQ44DRAFT_733417 [Phaeosphaeriaceae sp. PMI808]|nr:hypothetical protein GQ44DRAFT_733417 [Phaeosphaeriaceae sp. PMI808]
MEDGPSQNFTKRRKPHAWYGLNSTQSQHPQKYLPSNDLSALSTRHHDHPPSSQLVRPAQPDPSPGQNHYQGPQLLLLPPDIRTFAHPRNIPSPSWRPHGVPQGGISTYRMPPTTQSITASETVDIKPLLGMEHGNYHNPWSVNLDHRSNGSISDGYNPHINEPACHALPSR